MTLKQRYLTSLIADDLSEKMVFLGGPRQVGKTTLAKDIIACHFSKAYYYSWDKISQRLPAIKGEWPDDAQLIILDEFHKFAKWKTWIKGEWDTYKSKFKFLLTGSARLNIFRRGGDSLQGRYHYHTLHPFSIRELLKGTTSLPEPGTVLKPYTLSKSYNRWLKPLFRFGGFPEPFLKQEDRFLRRWHREHFERFFKEDVQELSRVQDLTTMMLLAEQLPNRASGILSINNLAQDLQVNFRTVSNWLNLFDQFYYCFRLAPYQSKKFAAVKKEKKLYLWDWSHIKNDGQRLENMVAVHLLKFCNILKETEGYDMNLCYLRDNTGREVDFLVTFDQKPWFSVEVKLSNHNLSKAQQYFHQKLQIPFNYQAVMNLDTGHLRKGITVVPIADFLARLA